MSKEEHELQKAFSEKEKTEKLISNLENLNTKGSLSVTQYTQIKNGYEKTLSDATTTIEQIKSRLSQKIASENTNVELYNYALQNLEVRFKIGELKSDEFQKDQQKLKEKIQKSENILSELNKLLNAQSSSDVGGYLEKSKGISIGTGSFSAGRKKTVLVLIAIIAVIAIIGGLLLISGGPQLGITGNSASLVTHNIGPTSLSSAVVNEQSTSLQLPAGAQLYLYGFGTGGAHPSSGFANGQYASVTNNAGYSVAALASSNINSNSFTTGTSYQVIGGVAISDFSTYTESYGSNPSPGAPSASDTFTVTDPESLVVIVAIAGDGQTQTVSGIPNLQIDAASPNDHTSNAMTIAHTILNPGTYTVTEQTLQSAAGQDPNNAGDLIGVWVFQLLSTSEKPIVSSNPTTLVNAMNISVNCSQSNAFNTGSCCCWIRDPTGGHAYGHVMDLGTVVSNNDVYFELRPGAGDAKCKTTGYMYYSLDGVTWTLFWSQPNLLGWTTYTDTTHIADSFRYIRANTDSCGVDWSSVTVN